MEKRKPSIQSSLFFSYFILIVFIILIIGVTNYKVSQKTVLNQVGKSRLEVLSQISKNIEIVTNEIISVSNLYYFDQELLDIIHGYPYEDEYNRVVKMNRLSDIFSRYTYSFDVLNLKYYCILYSFRGINYSSSLLREYNFESIPLRPWYNDIIEHNGDMVWIGTYNDYEAYHDDKYIFSVGRLLKYGINNKLGILLINVDENILHETYANAENSGSKITIIDKNRKIISNDEKILLGSTIDYSDDMLNEIFDKKTGNIIDNEIGALISCHLIQNTDWIIIEETPLDIVFSGLSAVKYSSIIWLLICLLFGFIMSFLIAKKIAMPIKSLCGLMKKIKANNLDIRSDEYNFHEINELGEGFNQMMIRLQDLMEDVRSQERMKEKVKLDFLQAQINPHFIYNTLNSIRCLVSIKKNDDAVDMLWAFMHLLKIIFRQDSEFIKVDEEITYINDYITIQKYKYPDSFDVIYQIEDEVTNYMVPKLMLQPIVENAIFHGIKPQNEKGIIKVMAAKDSNNDIIFKVIDNGVGMSDNQIKKILNKSRINPNSLSGIGIANVNERIELYFGHQYGINIESEVGIGTTVMLKIPITI